MRDGLTEATQTWQAANGQLEQIISQQYPPPNKSTATVSQRSGNQYSLHQERECVYFSEIDCSVCLLDKQRRWVSFLYPRQASSSLYNLILTVGLTKRRLYLRLIPFLPRYFGVTLFCRYYFILLMLFSSCWTQRKRQQPIRACPKEKYASFKGNNVSKNKRSDSKKRRRRESLTNRDSCCPNSRLCSVLFILDCGLVKY